MHRFCKKNTRKVKMYYKMWRKLICYSIKPLISCGPGGGGGGGGGGDNRGGAQKSARYVSYVEG